MSTVARAHIPILVEPAFSERQGVDWAQYLSHRPSYPESLFNLVFSYHQTKDDTDTWSTAHDVGAGCGVVAMKLASHFDKVVVSDPNDGYPALAKKCLIQGARLPESIFSFLEERAESSSMPDNSVDLITAFQMMHFTDIEAAVWEFGRQLKPGGTLAIGLYSIPRILNNEKAQAAWEEIWHEFSLRCVGHVASRAIMVCNSGFQSIELPEAEWTGVKRVYTNAQGREGQWMFSGDDRIGARRVKSSETEVWVDEDRDWTSFCDVTWMKEFNETLVPRIPTSDMQDLWDKLEKELDGQDAELEWPVVLILATKA